MNTPLADANDAGFELAQLDEWKAHLDLGFAVRSNSTAMVHKKHIGPLAVQKPIWPAPPAEAGTYPQEVHLYILHPPGGIVSGDKLGIDVTLQAGSRALLTSPGAAKFYRARADQRLQRQTVNLSVADAAHLDWLPHETIVFDGAHGDTEFTLNLAEDAGYIGWEITCLGLPHQQKPFVHGDYRQRTRICRNGRLVMVDVVNASAGGDSISGLSTLAGASVFATLLISLPASRSGESETLLEQLRAQVEACPTADQIALTSVNGIIVARYLGERSDQCKQAFIDLWTLAKPVVAGTAVIRPGTWNT